MTKAALKLEIDVADGMDSCAGRTVRAIDMTPTWTGILPALLLVIRNAETVEARQAAETELRRMAQLADKYVAEHKS